MKTFIFLILNAFFVIFHFGMLIAIHIIEMNLMSKIKKESKMFTRNYKLSLIVSTLLLFYPVSPVFSQENNGSTEKASKSSFSRTGAIDAIFDSSTLLLTIPVVSVDGIYYQVTMQLVGTNPALLLFTDAVLINSSEQVSATYDSSSLLLTIPTLNVDGILYSAQLILNTALSDYQFELVSLHQKSSYKVVDTGQSNCYNSSGSSITCTNSGQDGAYIGNIPDYDNNDDGTITDNITGLVWQKSPDTNGDGNIDSLDKLSQSAAVSYCSNLELADQSDWRLPDIKTLYSLIDFIGEDVSSFTGTDTSTLKPFINDNYFDFAYGDTNAGERIIDVQYATSTLYVSTTMNGDDTMFGVNMADGRIKGYGISIRNSEKKFTVQCVRGDESYAINSFVDNNNDTVSDTNSELMWQKNDSLSTKDWDTAISYCETDNTAGYADWRLPNTKELQSLVDYTRSPDTTDSAAINALFNSTSFTNEAGQKDWGAYWSSTTHKNTSGIGSNAAYVSFGRALGYMNNQWLDVHGAGAQRSDPKSNAINLDRSFVVVTDENGNEAITHGPQGDVVRINNYVRCVR
jgi:hypothetical protein